MNLFISLLQAGFYKRSACTVKTLFISSFLLISDQRSGETRKVGYQGESITFVCRYPSVFRERLKVLCRVKERNEWQLVTTATPDRFSLSGDGQKDTMTVTISRGTGTDAGLYSCAAARSPTGRIVCPVLVSSGNSGYEGGEVQLRCPYEQIHGEHVKQLYKQESSRLGDVLIQSVEGRDEAVHGIFALSDNTTARVLTVSITGLAAEGSGTYCCGTQDLDLIYTKWEVNVNKLVTVAGYEGQSVTVTCSYQGAASEHHGKHLRLSGTGTGGLDTAGDSSCHGNHSARASDRRHSGTGIRSPRVVQVQGQQDARSYFISQQEPREMWGGLFGTM
ncbi:uncharacterized protein LOC114785781 isoform X2 [Denticeps clupeoides]|uniref:uncharacterized protein LOC114785781 isoform X2 n=1 Tax=Denticeps clupeoides TaxID=299321 RepID=UPI0010A44DD3|nr:uncharacterized protein LOC114785781 isoform X2 [Denticeps clupeoides]